MRKFRSEAYEAIYEDFLAHFEDGLISEAEFRGFEANAFIDEPVNGVDNANSLVNESQEKKTLVTEHVSA